jgi:hypothetical protein
MGCTTSCKFEGNDDQPHNKKKNERKQRQSKACAIMTRGEGSSDAKAPTQQAVVGHLIGSSDTSGSACAWRRASLGGQLAARPFFKWRVLLRHRHLSCEVNRCFLTVHYECSHQKLQRQETLPTLRRATQQVRGPLQPSAHLVAHPMGVSRRQELSFQPCFPCSPHYVTLGRGDHSGHEVCD